MSVSVISVLLKVKVEMRPAPVAPPVQARPVMPNAQAPVNGAANVAPARVFRRQMPEPLSNMSSFKAAQAQAAKKAAEDNKENE